MTVVCVLGCSLREPLPHDKHPNNPIISRGPTLGFSSCIIVESDCSVRARVWIVGSPVEGGGGDGGD